MSKRRECGTQEEVCESSGHEVKRKRMESIPDRETMMKHSGPTGDLGRTQRRVDAPTPAFGVHDADRWNEISAAEQHRRAGGALTRTEPVPKICPKSLEQEKISRNASKKVEIESTRGQILIVGLRRGTQPETVTAELNALGIYPRKMTQLGRKTQRPLFIINVPRSQEATLLQIDRLCDCAVRIRSSGKRNSPSEDWERRPPSENMFLKMNSVISTLDVDRAVFSGRNVAPCPTDKNNLQENTQSQLNSTEAQLEKMKSYFRQGKKKQTSAQKSMKDLPPMDTNRADPTWNAAPCQTDKNNLQKNPKSQLNSTEAQLEKMKSYFRQGKKKQTTAQKYMKDLPPMDTNRADPTWNAAPCPTDKNNLQKNPQSQLNSTKTQLEKMKSYFRQGEKKQTSAQKSVKNLPPMGTDRADPTWNAAPSPTDLKTLSNLQDPQSQCSTMKEQQEQTSSLSQQGMKKRTSAQKSTKDLPPMDTTRADPTWNAAASPTDLKTLSNLQDLQNRFSSMNKQLEKMKSFSQQGKKTQPTDQILSNDLPPMNIFQTGQSGEKPAPSPTDLKTLSNLQDPQSQFSRMKEQLEQTSSLSQQGMKKQTTAHKSKKDLPPLVIDLAGQSGWKTTPSTTELKTPSTLQDLRGQVETLKANLEGELSKAKSFSQQENKKQPSAQKSTKNIPPMGTNPNSLSGWNVAPNPNDMKNLSNLQVLQSQFSTMKEQMENMKSFSKQGKKKRTQKSKKSRKNQIQRIKRRNQKSKKYLPPMLTDQAGQCGSNAFTSQIDPKTLTKERQDLQGQVEALKTHMENMKTLCQKGKEKPPSTQTSTKDMPPMDTDPNSLSGWTLAPNPNDMKNLSNMQDLQSESRTMKEQMEDMKSFCQQGEEKQTSTQKSKKDLPPMDTDQAGQSESKSVTSQTDQKTLTKDLQGQVEALKEQMENMKTLCQQGKKKQTSTQQSKKDLPPMDTDQAGQSESNAVTSQTDQKTLTKDLQGQVDALKEQMENMKTLCQQGKEKQTSTQTSTKDIPPMDTDPNSFSKWTVAPNTNNMKNLSNLQGLQSEFSTMKEQMENMKTLCQQGEEKQTSTQKSKKDLPPMDTDQAGQRESNAVTSQTDQKTLTKELQDLQGQVETLKEQMENMKTLCQQGEEKQTSTQKSKNDLPPMDTDQAGQSESNAVTSQTDQNTLTKELQDLQGQVETLKEQLKKANSDLEDSESLVQRLKKKVGPETSFRGDSLADSSDKVAGTCVEECCCEFCMNRSSSQKGKEKKTKMGPKITPKGTDRQAKSSRRPTDPKNSSIHQDLIHFEQARSLVNSQTNLLDKIRLVKQMKSLFRQAPSSGRPTDTNTSSILQDLIHFENLKILVNSQTNLLDKRRFVKQMKSLIRGNF